MRLVSVSRGSKFQIDYVMSDTTGSSFRCTPEFADFVVGSWGRRTGSSGELEPDVARLIVDQVCDILNLDGGAGVVYAEVIALVGAMRRERDGWEAAASLARDKVDKTKRQMGLAAKYISEYYELARDMHDPTALMDVGKIDAARRMVFAIGADMKQILEEAG